MKNSIFSAGLYKDALKRIKVASIIFMALYALTQIVIPLLVSISDMNYISRDTVPILTGPDTVLEFMVLIPFTMAPVLTLIAFYPFDKRGSSDFYHSLPYTRTCIFVSWTLAVISAVFVTILGGALCGYLIRLPFTRLYTLQLAGLGSDLITLLVSSLFAIACTALAMSITGTWLSNIAAAVLIMFLPRFLMYVIRSVIIGSVPILTGHFLPFCGFEYNVYVGGFIKLIINGVFGRSLPEFFRINTAGPIIYTLVVTLCYMALALIAHNRRRSEAAGQSAPNRTVQAVIRIAIAFTISALGTFILIEDSEGIVALILYLIAIIAFFAYEIITTHKWKNLVRALPSLAIVALLNVALFAGVNVGKNVVLGRNIQAEAIDFIQLEDPYQTDDYLDYFTDRAERIEIRDPAAFQVVSEVLGKANAAIKDGSYYSSYFNGAVNQSRISKNVAIRTGGQTVWRELAFTADQFRIIVEADISQEYKDGYMKLPEPVYSTMRVTTFGFGIPLTGYDEPTIEGFKQIHAALQRDIDAAGFEKWYRYLNSFEELSEPNSLICYLNYYVNAAGTERVSIPVTRKMFPETFDLIIEKTAGYRQNEGPGIKEMLETIRKNVNGDASAEYNLDLFLCRQDESGDMKFTFVSGSSWDGTEQSRKEILQLLEMAEDSKNEIDIHEFITVSYYFYDDNTNSGYSNSEILPLPENTEMLYNVFGENE